MKSIEDKKFFAEVINRAESGEHTKFNWICSWSEYKSRLMNKRALKLLIKNLDYAASSMFKEYCKDIQKGTTDVTKLLIRNVLLQTIKFYGLELAMINDMIDEYIAYLMDGKFIEQFIFCETRPYTECWDRRSME